MEQNKVTNDNDTVQMKIWLWGSPNGMMSIPNFTEILCVCILVPRIHNNIYHVGVSDLKALYYGASAWILALVLNGLPVCYCNAQLAGLHAALDTQPKKDNLHNHVNVRYIILVDIIAAC
jgi:hypothetical protein